MKYKRPLVLFALAFAFITIPNQSYAAGTYVDFEDIQQLYPESPHSFADWRFISQSADLIEDDGEAAVRFRMSFELTATDEDIYIPLSLRKASDESFGGFGYNIVGKAPGHSESPFTTFDRLDTTIETTAIEVNKHAYIPAGKSAQFSVEVIGTPHFKDEGHSYKLVVGHFYLVLKESEFYKNRVYMSMVGGTMTGGDLQTEYATYYSTVTNDEKKGEIVVKAADDTEGVVDDEAKQQALLKQIRDLLLLIIELKKQMIQMQTK